MLPPTCSSAGRQVPRCIVGSVGAELCSTHPAQVPRCIEGSEEAELDRANAKFYQTRFSKLSERNRCAGLGLCGAWG